MRLFLSGNPINKRTDKIPIYPLHTHLPPTMDWTISLEINKCDTSLFIEHLHFITMEENGFSYFYPDSDAGTNLCRFEWHYDFRNQPYFLRIGLCFKVMKSKIYDVVYSVQPHEKYQDIKKEVEDPLITDEEQKEIELFISELIETAKKRISNSREEVFNRLYYIQLQKPVKEVTYINNNKIMLLPSYFLDGQLITSIIIPTLGFSYLDSNRFGDEKANLFFALFTFTVGHIKLIHDSEFPLVSKLDFKNRELHLKKIKSFYPNCKPEIGDMTYIDNNDIELMNWFYQALDNIEGKNRRKIINILFTYYASVEAQKNNKTLALVGFVSSMNAISKILEEEYFKENGDRKTIIHYLSTILDINLESSDYKALDKWSKNVYNDHRSSFVHGANHKFEEYSQNMDGKNFAGLPSSIPSLDKPVSKQYEYVNDLNIAIKVSRLMVVNIFESFSGIIFDTKESFTDINFSMESTSEGYIGMVNNGWVKLT